MDRRDSDNHGHAQHGTGMKDFWRGLREIPRSSPREWWVRRREIGSDVISDIIAYAFMVGRILVLTRPGSNAPKLINEISGNFSRTMRMAIGPDGLARSAQERYVRGEIEADQLDAELQKIADEFKVI